MGSIRERLYISTIADDARELALAHGLGLEIAEYCTAYNMDERFAETDARVSALIGGIERRILHAPFNELCPAAIDPLVRDIARRRYRQAGALAGRYGVKKIVVHTGFVPTVYFPAWFVEQSVPFWKEVLREMPEDVTLCLENVMEPSPEIQRDILSGVDDPRFLACVDVGHAAAVGAACTAADWIGELRSRPGHLHVHDNDGLADRHLPLGEGVIDMEAVFSAFERAPAGATVTIENMHAENSVAWLLRQGII